MKDLRLYRSVGDYIDGTHLSEHMEITYPQDSSAHDMEVIAGKVVKFLLTEMGTDAFDPTYGGVAMHEKQISQVFLPEFRREVISDIERCINFIKNAETTRNITGERLYTINLLRIVYDPINTPTRVDVYIEIITTYGNSACVVITNESLSDRI